MGSRQGRQARQGLEDGRFFKAVAGLAALLGAVIFPAWLALLANPLQKLWPVISGLAAISSAAASVLSLRIVRQIFPPTSTSPALPPPLPANDRTPS